MTRSKNATAQGIDPDHEQNGHDVVAIQAVKHGDRHYAVRKCFEERRIIFWVDSWEDSSRGRYNPVSGALREWWLVVCFEAHSLCVRGVGYPVHV